MKFEYQVTPVAEQDITVLDLNNWLNQMGAQEWELITILPRDSGDIGLPINSNKNFTLEEFSNALSDRSKLNRFKNYYYFKRKIEPGEKLRQYRYQRELRKSQLKEVPNNDDESSRTTGGIPEEGL